jgi:hypothetical protein
MTPSQFRQALETLAFNDGSRMALQLNSGQVISGRFQTLLTNGDMVWFTEEHDEKERQWLVDVAHLAMLLCPQASMIPLANPMEP